MKQVHKIVLVTILLIISTDISYSKLISPREKPLQFQTLENNEKIIEKKNIKEKKIVNDAKQISTNVNEEQKKNRKKYCYRGVKV